MVDSYTYDLRGNQIVQYTDYSSGNPTTAEVYAYDLMNRMSNAGTTTSLTQLNGVDDIHTSDYANLTSVTEINTNIYNSGGQRMSKTEDSATEKYFYSGSALLYTQDNLGNMLTENILDLSGTIIASKRFDDDADPQTTYEWEDQYFFYHYDIRGSVTAIVAPDGNSVKEYTYDEFGNLAETGESSFDNEITYTGSITDTSTGLQYMNARFYEPSTGRFISQDSYTGNAYDPWTQHLYSYCGNNPTNFVDPTGHYWRYVNFPPYKVWVSYGGDGSREDRESYYDEHGLTMTDDADWRYEKDKKKAEQIRRKDYAPEAVTTVTEHRVEVDITQAGYYLDAFNNDEFAFSKAVANYIFEICGDEFETGIKASGLTIEIYVHVVTYRITNDILSEPDIYDGALVERAQTQNIRAEQADIGFTNDNTLLQAQDGANWNWAIGERSMAALAATRFLQQNLY